MAKIANVQMFDQSVLIATDRSRCEVWNLTRLVRHIRFMTAIILLAACQRSERRAKLLAPSAAACQPNAYLVELPPGDEFLLNGRVSDSTQTMRWIREVLSKRDSSGKYVNVRVDSSRSRDLD